MAEAWQNDWLAFVDTLAAHIRSGATNDDLSAYFGGKVVTWSGVLDEKSIDELAPLVGIAMPTIEMALGEGRFHIMDGISLPVAEQSISDWNAIEIGTSVTFTAKIAGGVPVFLPIEVTQLNSGRVVVMVLLKDGVPLQITTRY